MNYINVTMLSVTLSIGSFIMSGDKVFSIDPFVSSHSTLLPVMLYEETNFKGSIILQRENSLSFKDVELAIVQGKNKKTTGQFLIKRHNQLDFSVYDKNKTIANCSAWEPYQLCFIQRKVS